MPGSVLATEHLASRAGNRPLDAARTFSRRPWAALLGLGVSAVLLTGCSAPATTPDLGTPVSAAADGNARALLQVVDQQTGGMVTAERQGARFPGGKWVAKEALKAVSKAVRHMKGGQVRQIFRFLDEDASDALVKNANKVADKIDELEPYLGLPERVLRERLFNALSSFMSPGSAMQIADSVARAIGLLL